MFIYDSSTVPWCFAAVLLHNQKPVTEENSYFLRLTVYDLIAWIVALEETMGHEFSGQMTQWEQPLFQHRDETLKASGVGVNQGCVLVLHVFFKLGKFCQVSVGWACINDQDQFECLMDWVTDN